MVILLRKYATISVPVEVKRVLEEAKGGDEWGEFLLNLCAEAKRLRGEEAFQRLASALTEEELRAILESARDFRERLAFR